VTLGAEVSSSVGTGETVNLTVLVTGVAPSAVSDRVAVTFFVPVVPTVILTVAFTVPNADRTFDVHVSTFCVALILQFPSEFLSGR
jgi:hypothetical protein